MSENAAPRGAFRIASPQSHLRAIRLVSVMRGGYKPQIQLL